MGSREISKIILYEDRSTINLDLNEIKDYLLNRLGDFEIVIRERFLNYFYHDSLAEALVNTKVRELSDPKKTIEPLLGEIKFEEKLLNSSNSSIPGILYDGYKLDNLFQGLLAKEEIDWTICHIIFTPRLFGTFDRYDRRYHARINICGFPTIISTTGLIEAPAKPKEYYRIKQNLLQQNITTIEEFIPPELANRYLHYYDPRLTEVLKGYVMQGIFYHLTSQPFCDKPSCRLFNAHWQEELLKAQLTKPEFCIEHEKLLNKFNKN